MRQVLVVDDSRLQRRILIASLKRWGYEVREADSGLSALEICKERQPDLVISDWMMPEMDGLEFCRQFRELQREDYGYFILLTSKSEKDEIARGLDAGADDFLTKPVDPAELRARIVAGERILRIERELTEKNRLVRSTLEELQSLYESLNLDLIEAKKLQQSLISEHHRDFGCAEVSLLLRSSGHVGGDLVGMFRSSDTRIGLYGIDVSGHGVSSALMTARLAGYLSASAPEQNIALVRSPDGTYVPRPPEETVSILNNLILNEIETEHYFTLLLADVNLETGKVLISQAGHPCPLLLRKNGEVEFVGSGGLPVGLIGDAAFESFDFTMSEGDRLMIYSDGILECADREGRLLGEDGLAAEVTQLQDMTGRHFLDALVWRMARFAGDDEFTDDVSAILLEFKNATRTA